MEVRETADTNEEGGSIRVKEALIAYRYYDEEGHKFDDDLRLKYVGWSNKYDVWIATASPQIQRNKTVSRFYKVAGKSTMLYDDHYIQDSQDIFFNAKDTKLWAMSRTNHF